MTNLFEINRVLAVKLNQSFSSLYELPYYEYIYYLNGLAADVGTQTNTVFDLNREKGNGTTEVTSE